MLTIKVSGIELFDSKTQEFMYEDDVTLKLEHSLASLSKWEAIYEKPFLGNADLSSEETLGYIKAMTLNEDVPDSVYDRMTQKDFEKITDYIGAKMSATWFTERPNQSKSREIITAEIVYHWMIALQIPLECEEWHLNRLLTLIKVINEKNNPDKKKMSRSEVAARNRALNEQRRAQMQSKG